MNVTELKNLTEYEGRTVLLVAKVGSVNYNLDDETSDLDYKVYVLPSFDDLYSGKRFVTSKTSDELDFTVHDVRELAKQLEKSNVNFVEVLFSTELTVKDDRMKYLVEMREELARMNLPYFYDACFGMLHNKVKTFEKGTGGTNHFVEKHGYDTKAFMTMYRMMDFLLRYEKNGFTSFLEAVRYSEEERTFMLSLKHGAYSKERALETVRLMREQVEAKKDVYKSRAFDEETRAKMETFLKTLVYETVMK